MKTYNQDPNFSIVAPGGCNAACDFCFNKDKKGNMFKGSEYKYAMQLLSVLSYLPSKFYQISITGNEPLLSPFIESILDVCAGEKQRGQFTNILLTTNGTSLIEKFDMVYPAVHHINVSRHSYSFEENKNIFKGQWNVDDNYLANAIDIYSKNGIDVSFNCVIDDDTTPDFINEYISYAKMIGAAAVRFRKKSGDDLEPAKCEKHFANFYPVLESGKCPVCRTDLRIIRGLKTYWKSSIIEPVEVIKDTVYELVYNTDGNIYTDWAMKHPTALGKIRQKEQRIQQHTMNSSIAVCGSTAFTNRC